MNAGGEPRRRARVLRAAASLSVALIGAAVAAPAPVSASISATSVTATTLKRATRPSKVAPRVKRPSGSKSLAPSALAPSAVGPSVVAPSAGAPSSGAPAVFDDVQTRRLQAALEQWTKASPGVGSMTVAFRKDGRSWVGAARADGAPAPDPAAPYRIMSITKTFTAVLVLRAVAEGHLTLDGPLPPVAGVAATVPAGLTVRRLLGHRSGLVDYAEAPGYQADQPMTPERAVELSFTAPPLAPPGTTTKYTNSNYLLLGLLVQQVERRSYGDLVAGLAASFGLTHTHLDPPDRPGWAGFSSGGIMSDVADIGRWGDALFAPGRVLPAADLTLMATTGELEGGLGLWGVCPCVDGAAGVDRFTAIGHHTAAGGLFRFPHDGVTLVMRAGTGRRRHQGQGGFACTRDAQRSLRLTAGSSRVHPVNLY